MKTLVYVGCGYEERFVVPDSEADRVMRNQAWMEKHWSGPTVWKPNWSVEDAVRGQ